MFVVGYAVTIPLCLWAVVTFPFTIDRLPLYFVAPLVPFLLAGMALSMIFDRRARHRGVAVLRGPRRRVARRRRSSRCCCRRIGGESSLLVAAVAPCVAAMCLSSRLRDRREHAARGRSSASRSSNGSHGLAAGRPRRAEGDAPAHARDAGHARHADGLERVLAHRHRRGISRAESRAALHRLRRVDECAPVGRIAREHQRPQELVSRAAVQVRDESRDARHRAGRRLGRARRACRRAARR